MHKKSLSIIEKLAHIYTFPLSPREYARLFTTKIGSSDIRGKVVAVCSTPDYSAIELTIEPGFGFRPNFQAGQYVGLGVLINGQWKWRSYSLTNAPESSGKHLTFFIRRNTEGIVSHHIIDQLHVGDIVRLSLPAGQFVLPYPPPEKILFISSGSGITPILSMIRSLFHNEKYTGDVVHIHSERSLAHLPFTSELTSLADKTPRYRLYLQETSQQGRIDFSNQLSIIVPDWKERITWACGNNDMLKNLITIYDNHHCSGQLFTEKFAIDRAQYSSNGGKVVLSSPSATFDCQPGESILVAAENAGIDLPFGCRMGICHTCMLSIDEGHTIDMESSEVGEPGQKIRTCTSTVLGEVHLV